MTGAVAAVSINCVVSNDEDDDDDADSAMEVAATSTSSIAPVVEVAVVAAAAAARGLITDSAAPLSETVGARELASQVEVVHELTAGSLEVGASRVEVDDDVPPTLSQVEVAPTLS